MNIYDKCALPWLRNKALASTLDHIRYEDKQTNYISIGPVNKVMDMLCEYYASGGKSEAFRKHQERMYDYLWLASDGMKVQGYNGSQLWDTSFCLQAICESGVAKEFEGPIRKAFSYVDNTQVRENAPQSDVYFRHISKGAWPFSTRDHGWPISDCTAEGFRSTLMAMEALPDFIKGLDGDHEGRMFDAVNVMLSYQNPDGGWPSYEPMRGGSWLESLNPAECFGMTLCCPLTHIWIAAFFVLTRSLTQITS
jgi:squalene cyclase